MRQIYFLFLNSFLIFNLVSCTRGGGKDSVDSSQVLKQISDRGNKALSPLQKEVIGNNCIVDQFTDGSEHNLYGRECLEDKHLVIQTSPEGKPVVVSASLVSEEGDSKYDPDKVDGLRTEENPEFISKIYDLEYKILKNKGDDKTYPFLREDFLVKQEQSAEEKFYGSKGTKYRIVFKTVGDFLILHKASKNLENIPHTERTALPKDKNGKYIKEEGYYMVPFLGYRVEYCRAKAVVDNSTNKKLFVKRPHCQPEYVNYDSKNQNAEQKKRDKEEGLGSTVYLRVQRNSQTEYAYLPKKDLFPSKYFEGEWFHSEGNIETIK